MKSEKGTNRLTGEQIRSRKNSRIIMRIFGLSIAIFGIFAFIGFVNNPVFGPSSTGTWIYLLTALLFGGGLFTLSFFVPKLYLPSEAAKAMRTDPSANRSAELRQKADSEFAAIEGTHTGVLHEPASAQEHRQTYFCARCKKQLAEQDCVWIGNHRFCRDCAMASGHPVQDAERYRDPKFLIMQIPFQRPKTMCSRCGRETSEGEFLLRNDEYCLCSECRQSLRCFTLICKEAYGCMAYDVMDLLEVFVAEDSYVVRYKNYYRIHYSLVPFGFFAKSTGAEIAAKMNSVVPDGFCVPDNHALSADEIKNSEGFRVLIEYDRSRLASAPASEP